MYSVKLIIITVIEIRPGRTVFWDIGRIIINIHRRCAVVENIFPFEKTVKVNVIYLVFHFIKIKVKFKSIACFRVFDIGCKHTYRISERFCARCDLRLCRDSKAAEVRAVEECLVIDLTAAGRDRYGAKVYAVEECTLAYSVYKVRTLYLERTECCAVWKCVFADRCVDAARDLNFFKVNAFIESIILELSVSFYNNTVESGTALKAVCLYIQIALGGDRRYFVNALKSVAIDIADIFRDNNIAAAALVAVDIFVAVHIGIDDKIACRLCCDSNAESIIEPLGEESESTHWKH